MEAWRTVLRGGVLPQMPTAGLGALAEALRADDETLVQGATCSPPPLTCNADVPAEACCLVSYPFWMDGTGRDTVGAVEEAFARCCFDADHALGEPAAVRYLLNWFDGCPRNEMIRELLPEVEAELSRRHALEQGVAA